MKVIVWNCNGAESVYGNCSPSPFGGDYTLCGASLDGDKFTFGEYTEQEGKITCSACIGIINHCKNIKSKDIKR